MTRTHHEGVELVDHMLLTRARPQRGSWSVEWSRSPDTIGFNEVSRLLIIILRDHIQQIPLI